MGKSRSLTEKVYEELKEEIITAKLTPRQLIIEGELADKYNVSKTPVREALNRLKLEGFVEVIPFKGYFVSPVSVSDLQDLFELRMILEKATVEKAAQKITLEQLEELESILTAHGQLPEKFDYRDHAKANSKFHKMIALASGNGRLVTMIENVVEQMQRVLYLDLVSSEVEEVIQEHIELIEALRKHDPVLASGLMEKHINSSKERIVNRALGKV